MIWLADQEEIACQQQLERQQEEEEVTIVVDTARDESLQLKEDNYCGGIGGCAAVKTIE
jgi:hypothetical protein